MSSGKTKQWFGMRNVFEHDRVVPACKKCKAQDAVECSNALLSAGNYPRVL